MNKTPKLKLRIYYKNEKIVEQIVTFVNYSDEKIIFTLKNLLQPECEEIIKIPIKNIDGFEIILFESVDWKNE